MLRAVRVFGVTAPLWACVANCTLDRSGGDLYTGTTGGAGTTGATSGGGGTMVGPGGSTTSTTGGGGQGAMGGAGGGGAGAGGNGGMGGVPVLPTSCKEVPTQDGVYTVDPDGGGPTPPLDVRCDMTNAGGGWAMLLNSVGSLAGGTPLFWNIPYAERLSVKGSPAINQNFYAGLLYQFALEYRDEVVDSDGKSAELFRASAAGFDVNTMLPLGLSYVSGDVTVFGSQLQAGWSSSDFDNDLLPVGSGSGNCAVEFGGITQHYANCFIYNLGADADLPFSDADWGPHVYSAVLAPLGLATDGTAFSRVSRIARWVRW